MPSSPRTSLAIRPLAHPLGREAALARQASALVGLGLFAATLMVALTILVKLAA